MSSSVRRIGKVNRTLLYHNGILKLIYWSTESQNVMTEIVFLCDAEVGIGSPFIESETSDLVIFVWRTAYACLPEAVSCSATDAKTGLKYDLSRFVFALSTSVTKQKKPKCMLVAVAKLTKKTFS